MAREFYYLGGAVQPGASTLPPSAFNKFPEVRAVEIHLATGFQNIIYEQLPQETVDEAYAYIRTNLQSEWKEGKTEDQFLYSTRKKAIGPFKKQWWDLDQAHQVQIGLVLQKQFEFLFLKLQADGTKAMSEKYAPQVRRHLPRPEVATEETALEMASDLAD